MKDSGRIEILHAPTDSEPFIVLDKPSGMPTAPLSDGDESALSFALESFPEAGGVSGRKAVERGLVHRLDTATSGLVLIASTQEFYDFISAEQDAGRFVKHYRADVDDIPSCASELGGFPPVPACVRAGTFRVESFFRPFGPRGACVRPVAEGSGRAASRKGGTRVYSTGVSLVGGKSRALCSITAGFRHQVRCHLAWCGFPVRGDALYNPRGDGGPMLFRAVGIEFPGFSLRVE